MKETMRLGGSRQSITQEPPCSNRCYLAKSSAGKPQVAKIPGTGGLMHLHYWLQDRPRRYHIGLRMPSNHCIAIDAEGNPLAYAGTTWSHPSVIDPISG